MKPLDLQLSEKIGKLVKAEEGKCAESVSRAFIDHQEDLPKDAVYVEGIWMVGGQPEVHAWIEDDDHIIDPSYFCTPQYLLNEGVNYCPAKYWSWNEVYEHYQSQNPSPGKKLNLILGRDNPDMKKAIERCDPTGSGLNI